MSRKETQRSVLLLDERTNYGFNSCLIRVMARYIKSRGYNPIIVDLAAADAMSKLSRLFSSRANFAFAFCAGRGMIKNNHGKCIHEYFGIPLFAAFTDHPLYKSHFTDFCMDTCVYGLTDPGHVEFCKSHFHGDRYIHFPHFSLIPSIPELTEAEFLRRQKSLFFPAGAAVMGRTWSINASGTDDSEILRALQRQGIPISDFIGQFVKVGIYLEQDLCSFLKAHVDRFGTLDVQKFAKIFQEADVLVRALRRQKIIKALDGLPLTLIGNGWDQCNYLSKSVTSLPPTDYLVCEDIRRDYQMTLHTSHLQPHAMHDRILHSMSKGQAVLAERTPRLEAEISRGYMALFSLDAENIAGTYVKLLEDDSLRFSMCRAALAASSQNQLTGQAIADLVINALQERGLISPH